MASQTDDTPSNPVTTEQTEKVPPASPQFEWRRYGLIVALWLPVLFCASYFFVKLIIGVATVITPFIAGLVIALLLDPLVDRLEIKGVRRILAVVIVFFAFIGAITIIGFVCIPAIVNEATNLASNISTYIAEARFAFDHFLKHHNNTLDLKINGHSVFSWRFPKKYNSGDLSKQLTGQVAAFMQRSFGEIAAVLVGQVATLFDLLITVIVGFYLLVDIDRMKARISFLAPERHRKRLAEIGQDIGQVFADYLRGLLVVCALYGVATIVLLYALSYFPKFGHDGLAEYALLIGAIAGVLYAIPYIGSLTIGVITFLVALATGGFGFSIIAVTATLILNQTFDNIIAPRIVGGGVGLNPVLVIFSLSLGGVLFGFWGLLFSVPIAGSVQVVLFRLIPKLTQATPPAFLLAHGVSPKRGRSTRIMNDAPPDVKAKRAEEIAESEEKIDIEVAAENAEAPG